MHEAHAEAAEVAGLEREMHVLAVEAQSAARVGSVKTRQDLTKVDLPEPFLPSNPCTSPGMTVNEIPAKALAPPKLLAMFVT